MSTSDEERDMRAFCVQSFGETPAIHDLPIPRRDDAFLIRVTYAGVNPLDSRLLERLTANSTYPFVMGIDFAGVVDHAPSGESDLRAGERIFGMAHTHGSYAEYTAVAPGMKAEPVARIPDGVSDEQAAALPTSGVTALRSLDLLGVGAGQRLVVMGATGGVGGYAVQMALSRGASVVATVRGDAQEARRLGAEEVYDTNTTDIIDALRKSYPDGVDAVLDLVNGPDAIRRDAEILKPGGILVSTIFAADEEWFAKHEITAHNHASSKNPLLSPEGLREVARMLADGTITARIGSTTQLDNAGQILDELRHGGLHGRAVIRP
jgi:NADPH2:quinone reductase